MKEKEREGEEEDENQEESEPEVTYDITIHGEYIGTIRLKRGATFEDLIAELERTVGYKINLREFTVMLDGRIIKFNPATGRLSENPILASSGTLSLLKQIKGGDLKKLFEAIYAIERLR